MSEPVFVFLYGPPAVGKLTVARRLQALTGFTLFDNHISIDWARPFFEFGTEEFWRLVGRLRFAVYEEAASGGVSLISTFVYAPSDLPIIERLATIAPEQGGRNCFVQLMAPVKLLEERIDAPDRVERAKLTTIEGLQQTMLQHDLFQAISGQESLPLDTSKLEPDEAARTIAAHFDLGPSPGCGR